jgi:hypothetical protein
VVRDHRDHHANTSDVIHTRNITSKSQASRTVTADLADAGNCMTKAAFTTWIRAFLGLPLPLPVSEVTDPHRDSDVATHRCQVCSTVQHCDHNGNHFCRCPGAARPRAILHTGIIRVCHAFAREAQAEVDIEPATCDVLLGILTPEECRTRFPKTAKSAAKMRDNLLSRLLKAINSGDSTQGDRQELLDALRTLMTTTVDSVSDSKGLRVDLQIKLGQTELLIDVGSTHHTQVSKNPEMMRWASRKHRDEHESRRNNIALAPDADPTPVVRSVARAKVTKYLPLMRVLQAHQLMRMRKNLPKFLPCIVSHAGELSPQFFELIEILTARVKANHKSQRPLDGLTPTQAATSFRTRFKDQLATCVAKGYASILMLGGLAYKG